MKKAAFGLFLFFMTVCGVFAAIPTSENKLAVIVTEVSELDVNNFVELYSPNGVDAQNWKVVLNDPGSGVVMNCSFSHNFAAGDYYVINASNCSDIEFHPNKNEVFVLDASGGVVQYVSLWQDSTGQSTQSYMDYYDSADTSVTVDLNGIVDGNINYCSTLDPVSGQTVWNANCTTTPGVDNSDFRTDMDISLFTAMPSSLPSISQEVVFLITVTNNGPYDSVAAMSLSLSPISDWNILSSSASYGSYSEGVWSIPHPFAKNATATLSITAKMKTCATLKTMTASLQYPQELSTSNNQKSVEVTAVCEPAKAVEKGGDSASRMFTKVSGQSFDADILSDVPEAITSLRIVGEGGLLLDLNATPPTTVTPMADRLRLEGIVVNKAAMIAQFEVNALAVQDSFAIRPSGFEANQTSMKAQSLPIRFSAIGGGGGYNGAAFFDSIIADSAKPSCRQSGFFAQDNTTLQFADDANTTTLRAFDIGEVLLRLSDTTWTAASGDRAAGDCDAVGCDINSTIVFSIVPYRIGVAPTTQVASNDFQNMGNIDAQGYSDINKTYNGKVTAQSEQNTTLQNFDKDCFAKSVGVRFDFGVSSDTNASYAAYSGSSTLIEPTKTNSKLSAPISFTLGEGNFTKGEAPFDIVLAIPRGSYEKPKNPIRVTPKELNATLDGSDSGGYAFTDSNTTFLHSCVSMPNTSIDFAPIQTVRVYARAYALDPSTLPGGASGWVQAPGSSAWWINRLHEDKNGAITDVVIKKSSLLDTVSSVPDFRFTAAPPFGLTGGVAPMYLDMNAATNKDQKILLHFHIPTYLWYGSKTYRFEPGSNCTEHPCAVVDIFGTISDSEWYGSGENKGDKAIKSVPKGKRQPRVNW